jgi:hypothetical protein
MSRNSNPRVRDSQFFEPFVLRHSVCVGILNGEPVVVFQRPRLEDPSNREIREMISESRDDEMVRAVAELRTVTDTLLDSIRTQLVSAIHPVGASRGDTLPSTAPTESSSALDPRSRLDALARLLDDRRRRPRAGTAMTGKAALAAESRERVVKETKSSRVGARDE